MTANAANAVDDRGTDQEAARGMVREFCRLGFESDLEKAGLVLGRPVEELEQMIDGSTAVDDDLVMKIRGIAQERNIPLF